MYTFVLATHNIVRWLVLIVGLIAIVMAFIGWFGKKDWRNADDKIGLAYTILMDVNLLLGLLLYIFLSPITKAAFAEETPNFVFVLDDRPDGDELVLRFWRCAH